MFDKVRALPYKVILAIGVILQFIGLTIGNSFAFNIKKVLVEFILMFIGALCIILAVNIKFSKIDD